MTTISNPSTTETPYTMPAPSTDGFYVVKFVFNSAYEVWANPIFVNVP